MLQSLQQCPAHYIRYQTKKNQSLHHRSDRQHPLNLNNYRYHCQNTNIESNTTRGPHKTTRSPSEINTCLSQDITTDIPPQQVSHFTTVNPISSMDTSLITDTAIDGHTSFHTTLQVIKSQGSKLLHIKVNPGASCSSIPLSHFHKAFPKYFTKFGALKKRAFKPTWMKWSAHVGMCQNLLGYIVLDIQHNTLPKLYPAHFMYLKILPSQIFFYLTLHYPDWE